MAEEISYYAIVNDFSSIDRPAGVLRRIKSDGGERDETFGTDLKWGRSALLSIRISDTPALTNRYARVVYASALGLVAIVMTILLNQAAPGIVYKAF